MRMLQQQNLENSETKDAAAKLEESKGEAKSKKAKDGEGDGENEEEKKKDGHDDHEGEGGESELSEGNFGDEENKE